MKVLENAGEGSPEEVSQDADYVYVPCLSDELENVVFARFPRAEYWKLGFLNKRLLSLVKSGEIYKIRKEMKIKEPSVFMLASGDTNWWTFDRKFQSRRKLPIIPSDYNFEYGDKESFSAGTHLFVSGKEIEGAVVWRYELAANQWFKGPSMITPRCLFASATCGNFAFIAGGLETETCKLILNSAEKYDSETKSWERLPNMIRRRKLCSGCCMDNKFYVMGGLDENQKELKCGEYFDQETKTWTLVPNMLKDIPLSISQSPPLIAVANNELYSLDACSNELKVYEKESNSWMKLGPVPVRADAQKGWGVAFKSLGNELLLIGATSVSASERALTIYTCSPDPAMEKLKWRQIECGGGTKLNPFIRNCAVMVA
ncbi:F-box/kelch-repeat protein At3g27150 [Neltuma alba]|uniref:F-box/kelch-repeat protein At3g27150 n=1 Tax=Neltuma alba TaxID=207710 RepID=UPI0010A4A954|nr:F-box/kelch-repeat protein At3g27150 [Prosopis alba]XP_028771357.1 F-box/kelch-repeat protein At3g27150 [Prosopis alba]XP_028771358.1 F-box/kelch-repeat protein At3g27150 [Prosopis alba]XP_028771359.1 F-box/kelch-repeat protein At3g27150 [Prosopis alba]